MNSYCTNETYNDSVVVVDNKKYFTSNISQHLHGIPNCIIANKTNNDPLKQLVLKPRNIKAYSDI